MAVHAREQRLDLGVRFVNEQLMAIEELQELRQAKQMLFAPITHQAFRNVLLTGAYPIVTQLRELVGVALATDDRAHDGLTGMARDVADHIGELHVHLSEHLLHALSVLRLGFNERIALAYHCTQRAHFSRGSKRASEQTE